MKKNITMGVMLIVLLLQFFGLFPGLTNQDLADYIYSSVTGKDPVRSEVLVGE